MLKFFNLRVAAVLGGLALVGVAAYLNVHHAAESEGGNYLAPVCIAIVALAFGSALAVPVMLTLWRNGHRVLACAAFVGLVAGESYGFQLSAERLLAARDQRAQQVKTANTPRELAREALDGLERDRRAECKSGLRQTLYGAQSLGRQAACRARLDPCSSLALPDRGRHGPAGLGRGDCSGDGLLDWPADARSRARRVRRAQRDG